MLDDILSSVAGSSAGAIARGLIVEALTNDEVLVAIEHDEERTVRCAVLVTSPAGPVSLAPGDGVLAWVPEKDGQGIVLGRIGGARVINRRERAVKRPKDAAAPPPVEELVIEATKSLTLRVGEGSITIREDGKILIKGKDLVSHAQRMNRIKGGAVSIN